MQLRSVILYVKDLERMKLFYSQMLGASPTNQGLTDACATFETGSARFSLHAIPADIAKSIVIESPPTPREQHSLIGLAKFNGLDPEAYLREVQTHR
jgi:hypothetical protein